MDVDRFLQTLARSEPPAGLTPALEGLWWGLKGAWDRAHRLVQAHEDDPACAWVHAWLHRIEGDLGNAGYWYRRAGHRPARGSTEEEGRAIARALLGG
ncbi:MAG: hypothetical protein N2038_08425 [Geminicoccaceae bacterium]|nr:hypothetical protein [Geminicoccaceae bacterium]MCS7267565.1 hypothetical protein [Geminicoccaceae bacterium]MCX7630262.1 hypothetical protein [Geminicoccaceae bacterium]MDW8124579.1 hypothetical protein [Geminicoccaceae bacterium]MDW8341067.1 hypothetical protein [Geminicoccaceae bacterium]